MPSDDDKMWTPVKREDVTDLALLPGEMRAFRVEMRDEMRSIASTLQALVRIEQRLDVAIDRQNVIDRRQDDQDKRLASLDVAVVSLSRRVDALESNPPRRKPRKK